MRNILVLLLLSSTALASEHTPKLTGSIHISVTSGTIDADFKPYHQQLTHQL